MERSVLQGAAQTIAKHRPLLYIAGDRRDQLPALLAHLLALDYNLFWHTPPLYSPGNWFESSDNEFENAVSASVLGIHSSVSAQISGLQKIDNPTSDWRSP
jgi:hypothetical protein